MKPARGRFPECISHIEKAALPCHTDTASGGAVTALVKPAYLGVPLFRSKLSCLSPDKIMIPKVSIVIPVYNAEPYLRECLESVVHQTLEDIEIVCVDDGSKDRSGAILDEYAARDIRFKVIHKENGGYGKAMNAGMDAATGEYIGIVEPDDYIEPSMYETLYKKASELNLDLIKSGFRRFWHDKNGEIKSECEVPDRTGKLHDVILDLTENLAPYKFPMNTWTGIYKKAYLDRYHIRHHETPGASFQDNGFWLQSFWHARRAVFIPDIFYNYRCDNPNSSVTNPEKVFCMKEEYDWIREFLENDPELRNKFLGIYQLKKFQNYHWTFNRIDLRFKKMFLRVFHTEFKEAYKKGEIDISLFTDGERKNLRRVIRHPRKFYRKALKLPSLKERIFSVRTDGEIKTVRFLGMKFSFRTSK